MYWWILLLEVKEPTTDCFIHFGFPCSTRMFVKCNILCFMQQLKQPKSIKFEYTVTDISCHPSRHMIASGDIDGVVRLYVTLLNCCLILCLGVRSSSCLEVCDFRLYDINSDFMSFIFEYFPVSLCLFAILVICFIAT